MSSFSGAWRSSRSLAVSDWPIRVKITEPAKPFNLRNCVKRSIDIAISSSVLIFFLPVLALIWLAVRLTSPGPGLFWSRRVGRNNRIFLMPKFRSMQLGTPLVSREILSCSETALTPLGRFLRHTSLDELPQFWSVLRGDMSLIGPRALIPNDIAMQERQRYQDISQLRPGISGLAQIRGRNRVSPRDKARYDHFYATKRSTLLDLHILLQTLIVVLGAHDIE